MHELLTFVQQGYIFISKYPSLGSRAKFNLQKKEKTDSAGNKGRHFVSIHCKRLNGVVIGIRCSCQSLFWQKRPGNLFLFKQSPLGEKLASSLLYNSVALIVNRQKSA